MPANALPLYTGSNSKPSVRASNKHRIVHRLCRHTIARAHVVAVRDDVVPAYHARLANVLGRLDGQRVDLLFLLVARHIDADTQQRHVAAGGFQTNSKPRLRASAPGCRHEVINLQALFVRLLQQLKRAIDVAQRADRIRGAARNDVGLAAGRSHFICYRVHFRIEVSTARILAQVGAKDLVEKHIARLCVGLAWIGYTMLEQHLAGEAEFRRCRCGLPNVIGLHGADCDNRVGAFGKSRRHREFEFARLVAAGCETGAIVALDPDSRAHPVPCSNLVAAPAESAGAPG